MAILPARGFAPRRATAHACRKVAQCLLPFVKQKKMVFYGLNGERRPERQSAFCGGGMHHGGVVARQFVSVGFYADLTREQFRREKCRKLKIKIG